MADHVKAIERILQIGSQQRSWKQFIAPCELVRNGRIGDVQARRDRVARRSRRRQSHTHAGARRIQLRRLARLNAGGPLHRRSRDAARKDFDRPGWLRMEQFGAGMITGWGAHHVDTAHWGMNTELTGPVEIWGTAEFPTHGSVGRPRDVQDLWPIRQRRRP